VEGAYDRRIDRCFGRLFDLGTYQRYVPHRLPQQKWKELSTGESTGIPVDFLCLRGS
jgi:hypothetical protein